MYIALQWDHKIAENFLSWIVVECSGVTDKFGLPQALPPRQDIAYFVDSVTAQADAKAFAELKNKNQQPTFKGDFSPFISDHHGFTHYQWDHNYLSDLVKHAVLYWEDGKHQHAEPVRDDIAYFVDPLHAKQDSEYFSRYKLGAL
jgi:hypothetical protein